MFKSLRLAFYGLLLFALYSAALLGQTTCSYALSAASVTVANPGGTGTFTVTPTPATCSWSVRIFDYTGTVTASPLSGTGIGTVTYTVVTPNVNRQIPIVVGTLLNQGSYDEVPFSGDTSSVAIFTVIALRQSGSSLQIATPSLPSAILGRPYLPSAPPGQPQQNAFQLTATGGTPPYTWNLPLAGNYPNCSGCLYGTSGGVITTYDQNFGTAGEFAPDIEVVFATVIDSAGAGASANLPVIILPAGSNGGGPCASFGGDTDGDGLCDDWETKGIFDANGHKVVDLPVMGADPLHKDIFIQADYMTTCPPSGCLPGLAPHNHQPSPAAIAMFTAAFAKAPTGLIYNPDGTQGIRVHVDCGPDCVMNPVTGQLWGTYSNAQQIPEIAGNIPFGTASNGGYYWSQFDGYKMKNFLPSGRQQAFHYAVFAHSLPSLVKGKILIGISKKAPGADLIVAVGPTATPLTQGITFMHETGHNLSLLHGGNDDIQLKPNYLSSMNYSFYMDDGNYIFDYSRIALPTLDENNLDEAVGLNGGSAISSYRTIFFCATSPQPPPTYASGSIDWNCNGTTDPPPVKADINGDHAFTLLNGYNDWAHLIFTGGGIGGFALADASPDITPIEDPQTPSTFVPIYRAQVFGPGMYQAKAGETVNLVFTIQNTGTNADTYNITSKSSVSWGDLTGVPATVTLAGQQSAQITITAKVPQTASPGDYGRFLLDITSDASPNFIGEDVATVFLPTGTLPGATPLSFSPSPGAYTSAQAVTINNSTPGATIYYTVDDSTPTTSSTAYSGPITVSNTETIKAIAVAAGYSDSAVASATYTINIPLPVAASPAFSPSAGTFTAAQTVTIADATAGAAIYYTTDGTTPSSASAKYAAPVSVGSTETINAIAVASGYANSPIASATYTINLPQDFGFGLSASTLAVTAGQSGTLTASVSPVNGFTQPVTFTCSGLPSGSACSFSPSTVTPNGTASAMTTVTITTAAKTAGLLTGTQRYEFAGLLAGLSLWLVRRRYRRPGRVGLWLLVMIGLGSSIGGCGGKSVSTAGPTTSVVTINASSGSLTHMVSLNLTVQ